MVTAAAAAVRCAPLLCIKAPDGVDSSLISGLQIVIRFQAKENNIQQIDRMLLLFNHRVAFMVVTLSYSSILLLLQSSRVLNHSDV